MSACIDNGCPQPVHVHSSSRRNMGSSFACALVSFVCYFDCDRTRAQYDFDRHFPLFLIVCRESDPGRKWPSMMIFEFSVVVETMVRSFLPTIVKLELGITVLVKSSGSKSPYHLAQD